MKSNYFRKGAVLFISIFSFILFGCKKDSVSELVPSIQDSETPVVTVLTPVTYPVTDNINGYYIGLPSNYDQTNTRLPLLIFIPGAGQYGNGSLDLPLLLKDGPAQLFDEKRFPGTFKVNGETFSFIVFTPQLKVWSGTDGINNCIKFLKSKYRVDTNRIYLSGLSMGGILACDVAASSSQIAAVVPMAGIPLDYTTTNKSQQLAAKNIPVWAFHSQDDMQFDVSWVRGFISTINSFQPVVASKLTVWPDGGHDAWTRAIEPTYKENGKNMYEWMLQFHL